MYSILLNFGIKKYMSSSERLFVDMSLIRINSVGIELTSKLDCTTNEHMYDVGTNKRKLEECLQ